MTDVTPLTCVLNRACGSTDRTPSATAAIILASCGQRCASSHAIRPVSDIPINSATEVRPSCGSMSSGAWYQPGPPPVLSQPAARPHPRFQIQPHYLHPKCVLYSCVQDLASCGRTVRSQHTNHPVKSEGVPRLGNPDVGIV